MNGHFTLTATLLLALAAPLHAAPEEAPDTPDGEAQSTRVAPADAHQETLKTLREMPLKGEKLQLNVGGEEVFALFRAARPGSGRGGVVLLHDRGSYLDDPGVIHPLRLGLSDHGWATLSIQLPVPEGETAGIDWLDKAQPRVAAAVNELQNRNIGNIVLVGHGLGALAATDYLAAGDSLTVRGLVVISMDGSENEEQRLDGAGQLAKIGKPILDIYGGRDYHSVQNSAERRARAAAQPAAGEASAHTTYRDVARGYSDRKGDKVGYRQLQIASANHTFSRQDELLVRRIRGWLQRHMAETPQNN